MDLEELFDQKEQVLADMEEYRSHVERDRARRQAAKTEADAEAKAGGGAASFMAGRTRLHSGPALTTTAASALRLQLAVLPTREDQARFKTAAEAGSHVRAAMNPAARMQLFAIILPQYRPGPAFGLGHTLDEDRLQVRTAPGKMTWRDALLRLHPQITDPLTHDRSWQQTQEALARQARHCVRLDRASATQAQPIGSGFLLPDGTVLTARHVALELGYSAPASSTGTASPAGTVFSPAWVRYNRVNGAALDREASISAPAHLSPDIVVPDMALLSQSPDWQQRLADSPLAAEFSGLTGLALTFPPSLTDAELAGRMVAVIGHPIGGNVGVGENEAGLVFGDAPWATKRFMPGRIHSSDLWYEENGERYLRHDCSTAGGASGSCLVDLITGQVLGMHVGGSTHTRNIAIPIWDIQARLTALA